MLQEAQHTALAGAVELASAAATVPAAAGLVAAARPADAPQHPTPLLQVSEALEELTPSKAPYVRAVARMLEPMAQQMAVLQPLAQQVAVLHKSSVAMHSYQLQVCNALAAMEATSANTAVLCRTALEHATPQQLSEAPGPSAQAAAAEGFFGERKKGAIRSEVRRELLAQAKARLAAQASQALQEPAPDSVGPAPPDAGGDLAVCGSSSPGAAASEHLLPWPADLAPTLLAAAAAGVGGQPLAILAEGGVEGSAMGGGLDGGGGAARVVTSMTFFAVRRDKSSAKVLNLTQPIPASWVVPNTLLFSGFDQWGTWLGLYETPSRECALLRLPSAHVPAARSQRLGIQNGVLSPCPLVLLHRVPFARGPVP